MNINLVMENLTCYKVFVANQTKTDMVGVMVTPTVKDFIREVADKEERSLSYIAGAFLLRGIAAYLRDNKLKEDPQLKQGEISTKSDIVFLKAKAKTDTDTVKKKQA